VGWSVQQAVLTRTQLSQLSRNQVLLQRSLLASMSMLQMGPERIWGGDGPEPTVDHIKCTSHTMWNTQCDAAHMQCWMANCLLLHSNPMVAQAITSPHTRRP
jgi:hypothetical protein